MRRYVAQAVANCAMLKHDHNNTYDQCRQKSKRRQKRHATRPSPAPYASSGAAWSSVTASTAAVIGGTSPTRW
jgi:hypothetical protein